ncbi:MAG: sigma-70 family RNA polymerase sigma factor [Bacilli bacterium]
MENKYLGNFEKFISDNMGLVNKIGFRYTSYLDKYNGLIDMDDILQIATIGLIKAYREFDPITFTLNNGEAPKFSTYAYPKIHGEILRFLRDTNIGVKISRTFKEKISHFKKMGLTANDDYNLIAEKMDWTMEEVKEFILNLKMSTQVYIDEQINDETNLTLADSLPELCVKETCNESIILSDFKDYLDLRQLEVYELLINQCLPQSKVGEIIGVSQVHISRIFAEILNIGKKYGEGKFMGKRTVVDPKVRSIVEEFIKQNNHNVMELFRLLKDNGYTYQYNTVRIIFKRIKNDISRIEAAERKKQESISKVIDNSKETCNTSIDCIDVKKNLSEDGILDSDTKQNLGRYNEILVRKESVPINSLIDEIARLNNYLNIPGGLINFELRLSFN